MSWIEMTDGDITLTRIDDDAQWETFHQALAADVKLYDVATGYARVISYESLQEYVRKGTLCAWNIVRDENFIGYGIYSAYTGSHDVYIYRWDGTWDPDLLAQGMELLLFEVFEHIPLAERIFTYVPLPMPRGAEDSVLDLGFDPWLNDRERGLKKTYAIERDTWIAYHPES